MDELMSQTIIEVTKHITMTVCWVAFWMTIGVAMRHGGSIFRIVLDNKVKKKRKDNRLPGGGYQPIETSEQPPAPPPGT